MCNLRGVLVVCCLVLNIVDSMIFPLIPKLASNLDAKSLSDPVNFAKEYTFNLGQVSKDETGNFPLIGNSLVSTTNSDPVDDKIISGSFGIEVPNVLRTGSQNEIEIPSPFNLGLLPSKSAQNQHFKEPTPEVRSNLNNFEYQSGNMPDSQLLSNGPVPSPQSSNRFDYHSGNVPNPQSLPNGPPLSRQFGSVEIKNNSEKIPASSFTSKGSSCSPGKEPIGDEAKKLRNEPHSTFSTARFLNLNTWPKGPVASLALSGDIYLNSDSFISKS
ncbi:uncharacterized protein LOC117167423 [Belonocnema kinseyi]|uniref:uncharacterized protein LOC117167423 n=1 Tax=Belonocnema kinseyi TaxID=2817044 RepID=UPI00143D1A39|nr:uncharacterized protein LOC117167423 [Belonocnema kinseyi]XP_033208223.1 uncharacterized protein LOC117167423 [Belonocnema kinseyi]